MAGSPSHDTRDALKRFWAQRDTRERAALAFALIVTAFASAYAYVWLPVARERDRLLDRVPQLRAEAQAVERDARELAKLGSPAVAPIEVRAAIQQASAASQLPDSALEITEQDASRVRVAIASARMDQAFTWVARVQSVNGVRIESIRITALGDGDRAQVQAILLRGAR